MIKGSLVRKLPSYGRLSWAAFSPSCQHMSTTSSCQPQHHHHHHHHHHHQVVGKCTSSGTCEFRLEKTLGRETLCFSGKVASAVAEVGSLLLRLRALICKSCRQNVHRTVARARFALEKCLKNCQVWSTFGRWGWQNAHETVARARFHIQIVKH